MSKGLELRRNKNDLTIFKGNANINFDIVLKTPKGKLFCVSVQRRNELSCVAIEASKTKAHRLLGHAGIECTTITASKLGWKLMGKQESCENCNIVKAKQKDVPKVSSMYSYKTWPAPIPGPIENQKA